MYTSCFTSGNIQNFTWLLEETLGNSEPEKNQDTRADDFDPGSLDLPRNIYACHKYEEEKMKDRKNNE